MWRTRWPRAPRVLTGGAAAQRWAALSSSPPCWPMSTQAMQVAREETFGPVAALFRFKREAEAIAHGQ